MLKNRGEPVSSRVCLNVDSEETATDKPVMHKD